MKLRARVTWEPRDCWVGVYWTPEHKYVTPQFHVYICPLPTLLLHVWWDRPYRHPPTGRF